MFFTAKSNGKIKINCEIESLDFRNGYIFTPSVNATQEMVQH